MNKIFKYHFIAGQTTVLNIPMGARIFTAGIQNDNIVLWALVGTKAPQEYRTFHVYGTGDTVLNSDSLEHLTTLQDNRGLVWRVFFERV